MPETQRRIGRYEVYTEIGRGGFGVVYLARQIDLNRQVALKELTHWSQPKLVGRFKREARAIALLSGHPNIVTVHDYFVHDNVPYISMEFLPRGALEQYVAAALTLPQIAGVLVDTLAGLEHAAGHAVVHRDLKPANLMVSSEGRIKIADFGIAKAEGPLHTSDPETTPNRGHPGSPDYMAPEQILGDEVGPWTDLYALGVTAYQLLARQLPYPTKGNGWARMMNHLHRPVPRLEDVDDEIADWVFKLMAKQPEDRPGSAREARAQLDAMMVERFGPGWERQAPLPAVERANKLGLPHTPPPDELPAEPLTSTPATTASKPPPSSRPVASSAEKLRPRRRTVALAAVPLVAAAAALTAVTWPDGSPTTQPKERTRAPQAATQRPMSLAAGPLRAIAPGGWAPARNAPELPGLPLKSHAAAAPAGDGDAGAVLVGMAPKGAANPDLLPREFLDALGLRRGVTPAREEVDLSGGLRAYVYRDLRPPDLGRRIDVYVAPTSAGVAAVACVAPTEPDGEFDVTCSEVARSTHLSEATAVTLGPDPAFARALSSVLAALERDAGAARKRLVKAATDQASYRAAARSMRSAFAEAAAAVRALEPGPADATATAALRRELDRAAKAFARLAGSASRSNAGLSAKRAKAAGEAARSADKALGRLIRNGYPGQLGPRVPTASVPRLKPREQPRTAGPSSSTSAAPPASAGSTGMQTQRSTGTGSQTSTGSQNSTATKPNNAKPKADPKPTADEPITTDG